VSISVDQFYKGLLLNRAKTGKDTLASSEKRKFLFILFARENSAGTKLIT
jgi:hypothetical protein